MKSHNSRLAFAVLLLLEACAHQSVTTQIASSAPHYVGRHPVERLYIYSFLDVRPGYLDESTKAAIQQRFSDELGKSGVSAKQSWFAATRQSERIQADPQGHTLGDTSRVVSVQAAIQEFQSEQAAHCPTHRLVAFPEFTYGSPDSFRMNIKWDLVDTSTGYIEWSVYSTTTARKSGASAEEMAGAWVNPIITELRARGVVR